MIYKTICGSRSYGLELPTSDYDIVVCGENNIKSDIPHSHEIIIKPENFHKKLLLLTDDAYDMQLYFPSEILISSELSDYIDVHKEEIISANLNRVYSSHMRKANGLSVDLDKWGIRYPKRSAYSCLFYDTIYRYATQDIVFENAFKPDEDFKQWLLLVKKREIPIEEILKRNEELRKRAESVSDFYANVENKIIINKTISDINEILQINI